MGYSLKVNEATLTPILRQMFGDGAEVPLLWNVEPLTDAGLSPSAIGLYRVSGSVPEDWSIIVKVFAQPADPAADTPQHPFFWRREINIYQSGTLGYLPYGLRAPYFYDVTHQAGGISELWIEDMGAPEAWPLERLMVAARSIGLMGGRYLIEYRLPDVSYLSRGMILPFIADSASLVERACHPDAWKHPLLREAFPQPPIERIAALWQDRTRIAGALAKLPQTLAHHDCWRKNLFTRINAEGDEDIVLIDWELAGHGAAGEDAGNLLGVSLLNFDLDAAEAQDAADALLIAYLNGLADGGWRDDPTPIRFAFNAAASLRSVFSAACWPVAIANDKSGRFITETEERWQRPIEEIFAHWAKLTAFLLDRGESARRFIA